MISPKDQDELIEVSPEQLTSQELVEMEMDELDDIFTNAEAPAVGDMEGTYSGLPLAGIAHEYLPPPLKKAFALYAGSPLFLWKGKEFEATSDENEGKGTNLLISLNSPLRLFSFTTRIEPSEFDDKDCLVFDYDSSKNPVFIRIIKDELRRVNSMLYLGRVYVKIRDESKFALYFCLEVA